MSTHDVTRDPSPHAHGGDHSEPGKLETDAVLVRSMRPEDAEAVARIDETLTGRARRELFRRKIATALRDAGVSLSVVAELDGRIAGYLLASVDYGQFGVAEPVAVLDAIGVHPDFRGRATGSALLRQLVLHLRALGVERVRTEVALAQWDLLRFLERSSFDLAPRLVLEARTDEVLGRLDARSHGAA